MSQKRLSQDEKIELAKRKKTDQGIDDDDEMDCASSQVSLITQSRVPAQNKIFNDPIHGHIEMHPLFIKVIDTPQFQRLRYIKQLGGACYVFYGASHTRFEHSIGVGYLAWELAKSLQVRQPELDITDVDALCVGLAGLCHDLGHGILSHVFDNEFLPRVRDKEGKDKECKDKEWKHEKGSIDMLQYLIDENKLKAEFEKYQVMPKDIIFIKEQIFGPLGDNSKLIKGQGPEKTFPYTGRDSDKAFLYEIVANKRNGVDVDKWDYFARDSINVGVPISFDYRRAMRFVRAIRVDEEWQLCTRDKEADNIYDMFYTRQMLHRRVYQHKTVKLIESMIVDALIKANDELKFEGKKGEMIKLSETIKDMMAYANVTDDVIQRIKFSNDDKLKESREILQAIEKRQLHKCVGRTAPLPKSQTQKSEKEITEEIINSLVNKKEKITEKDIYVCKVGINYGMKDKDPIDSIRFYYKYDENQAISLTKEQISKMLPASFNEQYVLAYSKNGNKSITDRVKSSFDQWCKKHKLGKSKYLELDINQTPLKNNNTTPAGPSSTAQKRLPFSGQAENDKKTND